MASSFFYQAQRPHDVLTNAQMREQVEALKNHAHLLAQLAQGAGDLVQQWSAVDQSADALCSRVEIRPHPDEPSITMMIWLTKLRHTFFQHWRESVSKCDAGLE